VGLRLQRDCGTRWRSSHCIPEHNQCNNACDYGEYQVDNQEYAFNPTPYIALSIENAVDVVYAQKHIWNSHGDEYKNGFVQGRIERQCDNENENEHQVCDRGDLCGEAIEHFALYTCSTFIYFAIQLILIFYVIGLYFYM